MRLLVISAVLLLTACGRSSEDSTPAADNTLTIKNKALASFTVDEIPLCDRATFSALADYAGVPVDLTPFHTAPGVWGRGTECLTSGQTVSATSPDIYLAVAMSLASSADEGELSLMGDEAPLMPDYWLEGTLIAPLLHKLGGGKDILPGVPLPAVRGYRAHLDMLYMVLKARLGALNSLEAKTVKNLADANPTSIVLEAAQARFNGGDYTRLRLMLETAPMSGLVDYWGSLPADLAVLLAISIMEGK